MFGFKELKEDIKRIRQELKYSKNLEVLKNMKNAISLFCNTNISVSKNTTGIYSLSINQIPYDGIFKTKCINMNEKQIDELIKLLKKVRNEKNNG